MDEQVYRTRGEFHQQLSSRQWHLNLRAGPESVLLLAECQLLVSKPETLALELSSSGLV